MPDPTTKMKSALAKFGEKKYPKICEITPFRDGRIGPDESAAFVAFFLAASGLGEGSTIPRLWFFLYFYFILYFSADQLAHANSTLYANIGPQWLSELRQLWPSVPWRVACELVSLISSHTMPGQHYHAHSDCVGSRLCACLGVTCHLHFGQNDRGFLRATAVARGGTDSE